MVVITITIFNRIVTRVKQYIITNILYGVITNIHELYNILYTIHIL